MAPATVTATVAAKPARQPKSLPAPNSDFYDLYETLNGEELATAKQCINKPRPPGTERL